jgi:hypothetical protein
MRFDDAIFNWLQIKLVADGRPHDLAAQDTERFFWEMLTEDHHISHLEITKTDDTMIHIAYTQAEKTKKLFYDREHAEQLLNEINAEPRYNLDEKVSEQ